MKLAALALLAMAASADDCMYTAEAVGVQLGDGGIVIPLGYDGGTFLLPTGGSNSVRPLRQLPDQKTLCMLVIGDWSERTDYPKWIGSYIDDVRAPFWLGDPGVEGEYKTSMGASLRYSFQKPKSLLPAGAEVISLQLQFEHIPMFERKGSWQKDNDEHGAPWPNSYFLSEINVQGMPYLECWMYQYRESKYYHFTPCELCHTTADYYPCMLTPGTPIEECFK
jgi:hypothetical protein